MDGLDISLTHLNAMSGGVDVFKMSTTHVLEGLGHINEIIPVFAVLLGDIGTVPPATVDCLILFSSSDRS